MYMMLLHENNLKLTPNFSSKELICKCDYSDCNHSFINNDLVMDLQRLREYVRVPLFITSAFRCQRHNKDVGGHDDSYHKKGHAVDIAVPKDFTIEVFAEIARDYFDVVLEYHKEKFIHCHNK